MEIVIYQVDAFAKQVFSGNPAAICLLNEWLPAPVMQAIAKENNLPETAFLVEEIDGYLLRWFTPSVEVDLCGHATLASAHVVFQYLKPGLEEIVFKTNSGSLTVKKYGDEMQMDFPALSISAIKTPPELLLKALKLLPHEVDVYGSVDYLVILQSIAKLKSIQPNFDLLMQLDLRGVIVSAASDDKEVDFVSRFFAPKLQIFEDPITGSAHCELVPYWSAQLQKNSFKAHQLTSRNVKLRCELVKDRVLMFGNAVTYLIGKIMI